MYIALMFSRFHGLFYVCCNCNLGGIINHDALVQALKEGQIHAAGLDVTDPEPLPRTHTLLKLKNVIITPHIGTQTIETRIKMFQLAFDNLKSVLVEKRPMPSELLL